MPTWIAKLPMPSAYFEGVAGVRGLGWFGVAPLSTASASSTREQRHRAKRRLVLLVSWWSVFAYARIAYTLLLASKRASKASAARSSAADMAAESMAAKPMIPMVRLRELIPSSVVRYPLWVVRRRLFVG